MKLKLRSIRVQIHDQAHFEHLLNLYAQEGWYLKRKFKSLLIFEHDPTRDKAITVLVQPNQENKEFQRHLNDLQDFGYSHRLTADGFVFLEHPKGSVYVSDQGIDKTLNKPKRQKVQKWIIREVLLNITLIAMITLLFQSNRRALASLVFTNHTLIILVILIVYYIGVILHGLWRIVRTRDYVKAIQRPIPYNFQTTQQTFKDSAQLLGMLCTVSILVILSMTHFIKTNNFEPLITFTAMILLFGPMFLLFTYFDDKASVKRKISLLVVSACALVGFLILSKPPTTLDTLQTPPTSTQSIIPLQSLATLTESNQCQILQQHQSWVARLVVVSCGDNYIEITQAFNERFLQIISLAQTGQHTIKEHSLTPARLSNTFPGTAYRNQAIIVVATKAIPDLILKELANP